MVGPGTYRQSLSLFFGKFLKSQFPLFTYLALPCCVVYQKLSFTKISPNWRQICVMLLTEIRLLLDVQDENYERKSSVAECALQLNTIVLRYGAALLGARSNNFQFAR